ncbi:CoA-binding protein [Nocardioides yefusunii]|uniref:CoA-binding protein n=1 Tax=Nocardioides yefusunii TaxID=2500546 RepID=A0ABW1R0P1_9ACTN|nr:CoA-binding protein [Nocardioides yefusunii]
MSVFPWHDQADIDFMLDETETWAVVGLKDDPTRTAYSIAATLQSKGKRIVPVHPSAETVLGEQGYATLADIPFPVDVVDVFVSTANAGPVADQAVEIGAKGVWFQLGVLNQDAYLRTKEKGLAMIMDTCPAIEWGKRR